MPISIRTEATVAAHRIAEFEALHERLFDVSRAHPGFQGGVLLSSLSNPLGYTRISVWDDLNAVKAFWKGQAFREFVQQNPDDGMSTFTRPLEAYELLETVRDPGQPTYVALVERTIQPSMLDAFVESRKEFFKLQRTQGRGAVTSALSRLAGSLNKTVVYLSYLRPEDATAFFSSGAYREWAAKHGNAYDAAPPTVEGHAAVLVHAPVQAAG